MTNKKANIIMSFHLMQCSAMMPIEWVQKNGKDSEFMQAYKMAMDALKNAPVMCKDCKHLMFSDLYGECKRGNLGIVKPDDFCSYGERKEGDGNG